MCITVLYITLQRRTLKHRYKWNFVNFNGAINTWFMQYSVCSTFRRNARILFNGRFNEKLIYRSAPLCCKWTKTKIYKKKFRCIRKLDVVSIRRVGIVTKIISSTFFFVFVFVFHNLLAVYWAMDLTESYVKGGRGECLEHFPFVYLDHSLCHYCNDCRCWGASTVCDTWSENRIL